MLGGFLLNIVFPGAPILWFATNCSYFEIYIYVYLTLFCFICFLFVRMHAYICCLGYVICGRYSMISLRIWISVLFCDRSAPISSTHFFSFSIHFISSPVASSCRLVHFDDSFKLTSLILSSDEEWQCDPPISRTDFTFYFFRTFTSLPVWPKHGAGIKDGAGVKDGAFDW